MLLIIVVAVPLIFIFSALSKNIKPVIDWINYVAVNGLPSLPQSVANIPLIGKEIAKLWNQYHNDPRQIISDHHEQFQAISKQAMTGGLSILATMLDIIIGIIISAVLLVKRKEILTGILLPLERLLGSRSAKTLLLATTMAIRGVSIGVMGTALIAAIIAFIGFAIAGVPLALLLSVLIFFLVVLQIGPLPVWIPLIIWMSTQDHPGKVIFLIIWGIILLVIDYIIKPILIGKSGGKLPFLVLFLGVIGGLAAWGFTGMFKGAIILAVFYTIYNSWLKNVSKTGASHRLNS